MFVLSIIGLLVVLITLTCLAETDNGGWGIGVILCVLAACEFWLFKGSIGGAWSYVANNPGIIVGGVLSYLIVGVWWSIGKWKMWIDDYLEKNKEEIKKYVKNEWEDKKLKKVISPLENKSRITTWMGYWPLSFCWFIINKPVTRFYNWLFNKLKRVYQGISENAYKKITN